MSCRECDGKLADVHLVINSHHFCVECGNSIIKSIAYNCNRKTWNNEYTFSEMDLLKNIGILTNAYSTKNKIFYWAKNYYSKCWYNSFS